MSKFRWSKSPSPSQSPRRARGFFVGLMTGLVLGMAVMFLSAFSSSATIHASTGAEAPSGLLPSPSISIVNETNVSVSLQENSANTGDSAKGPSIDSNNSSGESQPATGDESTDTPKPKWLTTGNYVDDDGVEFLVISSSDLYRQREAEQQLWSKMLAQVSQKIDDAIVPGAAAAIQLDMDHVKEKLLCRDCLFTEVVTRPSPIEFQGAIDEEYLKSFICHGRIRLDGEFYDWAETEWQKQLVRSRVLQVALFGIGCIGLLGIVAGYLRANHQTRGFYNGRLQMIVIAAVLILIAIGLAASKSFVWL